MKTANNSSKYIINRDVIFQKLDEKFVGFDVNRSFFYTFNETAEFILKKIRAKWSEDKIINEMSKKYEVALGVIKRDVKQTIQDLKKNKIILVV